MQNENDPTFKSQWRRVAFVEDFYDILTQIHCQEKGHIGEKKTAMEVSLNCTVIMPRWAEPRGIQ